MWKCHNSTLGAVWFVIATYMHGCQRRVYTLNIKVFQIISRFRSYRPIKKVKSKRKIQSLYILTCSMLLVGNSQQLNLNYILHVYCVGVC